MKPIKKKKAVKIITRQANEELLNKFIIKVINNFIIMTYIEDR